MLATFMFPLLWPLLRLCCFVFAASSLLLRLCCFVFAAKPAIIPPKMQLSYAFPGTALPRAGDAVIAAALSSSLPPATAHQRFQRDQSSATRSLHAMQRDRIRRGAVTLRIGSGQGIALALEAV
jgi:hypothetical protein